MNILPKDIEEIIVNYKNQIEHFDKYKYVLCDIKNNLSIKYLVPVFEFDSGYLCRDIRFYNKPFKSLSAIICYCCGRQIYKTTDEYSNDNTDDEVIADLDYLYMQIIEDNNCNRSVEIKNFNDDEYNKVCDLLEETQNNELENFDLNDEEILEILFEEGDLDDIEFEELIRDLDDITDDED